MKTLSVLISDVEYSELGFFSDKISFSELKEKISIDYAKEAITKCHEIAEDTGLSEMTLEEINVEILTLRENAKNRH